jgi:mRNA interferase MazF
MKKMIAKRNGIYYASLDPVIGSEQNGIRPVLVVQNDIGNKHSSTTIIVPIPTKYDKIYLPTHVYLPARSSGLIYPSVIECEQVRVIDESRFKSDIIDFVEDEIMQHVEYALLLNLGITPSRLYEYINNNKEVKQ